MPLDKPNPAPNSHMTAAYMMQGFHPIDRSKQGPPRSFTANAGGSSTTILGPDADNTDIFVGDKVRIYTSANVLKHNSLHTITGKVPSAGTTTYTFTPAAGGSTASGDYIAVSQDITNLGTITNFQDMASIDARLIAIGAPVGVASQAEANKLTLNDKIHRLVKSDEQEMSN